MSLTVSKMALATLLASGGHRGVDAVQANPIRKVVNMLQAMQEKVKTEGEMEDELMSHPDLPFLILGYFCKISIFFLCFGFFSKLTAFSVSAVASG